MALGASFYVNGFVSRLKLMGSEPPFGEENHCQERTAGCSGHRAAIGGIGQTCLALRLCRSASDLGGVPRAGSLKP